MANGIVINKDGTFTLTVDDFSKGQTSSIFNTYRGRGDGFRIFTNSRPMRDGSVKQRAGVRALSTSLTPPSASQTHDTNYFRPYHGIEKGASSNTPDYSIWGATATNWKVRNKTGIYDAGTFANSGLAGTPTSWGDAPLLDDVQFFSNYEVRSGGTATSGSPGSIWMYGGSKLTSAYSTGTVGCTTGSKVVVGSGTTWTSAHLGAFFTVTGDSAGKKAAYKIVKVVSSTNLILDREYNGDSSGNTYSISPYERMYTGSLATNQWPAADSYAIGGKCVATAWGRVIVGGPVYNWSDTTNAGLRSYKPNRLQWSGRQGSTQAAPSAPFIGMHAWHANGYVDLPISGGAIVQLLFHKDRLFVFREHGMSVLSGQPDFDGEGSLTTSQEFPAFSWQEDAYSSQGKVASPSEGEVYFFVPGIGPHVWSAGMINEIPCPFSDGFFSPNGKVDVAAEAKNVYFVLNNSSILTSNTRTFTYHKEMGCWTAEDFFNYNTNGDVVASSFSSPTQIISGLDQYTSKSYRVAAFDGNYIIDLTNMWADIPGGSNATIADNLEWVTYSGKNYYVQSSVYSEYFSLPGLVFRPNVLTVAAYSPVTPGADALSASSITVSVRTDYGPSQGAYAHTYTYSMTPETTVNDLQIRSAKVRSSRCTEMLVDIDFVNMASGWRGVQSVQISGKVVSGNAKNYAAGGVH